MTVIVRDDGFHEEDFNGEVVNLASDSKPDTLPAAFDQAGMIRVAFPSFSDGRGFTLARQLRARGYTGRLRAEGHVLSDQYAMARRAGFDEVEISADLAARQPQDQWQFRADWRAYDYRSQLKG